MLELLEEMPELQEDERTIVSTRVFNAPRRMVYEAFADPKQVVGGKEGAEPVHMHKTITWQDEDNGTRLTLRNQFGSRELRDENVRTYGSVKGGRDLFERLTAFLAKRAVAK